MTAAADEPDGWDPTRPLGEGERSAEEPASPAAEPASDDPGDPKPPVREAPGQDGREEASSEGVLVPHLERLAALATRASALESGAARYARMVEETLRSGGKVLLCGNGGSAATVEHVAAEYQVRFERERRPLAALALSSAGAVASAAANDYTFEEVFARQVRALGTPGDLLVLHSTTGESENLIRAVEAAREGELGTVAVLAGDGGRLAERVDVTLVVPTGETARAQEIQLAIEHAVVDRVDRAFAGGSPGTDGAAEPGG